MEQLKIWAHRGASAYAPENTMEAFKLAVKQQADGLDISIHRTKDGEIVVIHDDTIDRTSNGTGEVANYTLAELKAFNFNARFEQEYTRAEIPTFVEVLQFVKENNLALNIEENFIFSNADRSDIHLEAARLVAEHGLMKQVSFSSFDHSSMARLKQDFPDISTGLLYLEELHHEEAYAKAVDANALHGFFISISREKVHAAHEAGVKVHAWTVNDVPFIKSMLDAEVDVVITDCPDICSDLRGLDKATRDGLDEVNFRAGYGEVKSYSFLESLYDRMAKNEVQEGQES
ncbi:glycerophosphodiester phosphodiesterase family protein [Paenibacillus sp. GCM10012306]|uniref:glycerophosphodiester phosphodiesterase family protein n=1 Tax=Paenibacillus sp. GCM10012306 TaxID=3317342 RepID=UPI003618FDF0